MKDVLGFEIILGNVYEYSNRQNGNGNVTVVIGKAVKFNEGKYFPSS